MKIENHKGLTLWGQIASQLISEIQDGVYSPGGKLPTEMEMAATYGVNRHTIRRALEDLNEAGIIRTEHGRGSFVADEVLDYRVGRRPRFSQWLRSHDRKPIGEILELRQLPVKQLPEGGLAKEALELTSDDQVVLLERIGRADSRPVVVSRHIFPALPGLLAAFDVHRSITAALIEVGVADYTRLQTRVFAKLPDVRIANLLGLLHTDPLLICENVNVDAAGKRLEFCIACYPSRRVQLVFE